MICSATFRIETVRHFTNITYIVVDGTEIGSRNRIPLWLFGMMY